MKKTLIIAAAFLVLLVITLLLLVLRKPAPFTAPQTGVSFPNATTTSSAGQNSFLNNPDTKQDPYDSMTYYLGNQPLPDHSSNPPYLISYNTQTGYFNVTLFQEPIGELRRQAEQYLQQRLGLSQEQMCSLKYVVGVPDFINTQYSDTNLGFSFCPGAVQLPD